MTMTNRRAEDFDRALSAGSTHPDATMAALVAVAGALAAVPKGPAPAFRDALRTKLMAEAAAIAAAPAAAAPVAAAPAAAAPAAATPLQVLAKVLAKPAMQVATGGLAATIAVAGVGAGAARSLPGDALYGLRRAIAGDDRGAVDGTVDRVDEILALLDRDGLAAVGRVERTLADVRAELDAATADLLAQVRAGSRDAYERLARTVKEVSDVLQALRAQLPPAAQDELDAAMATVNSARAQLAALPVPGGTPAGPGRGTPTAPVRTSDPASTTPPSSPVPSSIPPRAPTTSPGTPTVAPPTITTPPVTVPPVPPVPAVEPTLPVRVPSLVP